MQKILLKIIGVTVVGVALALATSGCSERTDGQMASPEVASAPTNLVEAVDRLDALIGKPNREKFRSAAESELSDEHFGLAGLVRNEWIHQPSSPLRKYFETAGVSHADDMSAIVILSLIHI